MTQPSTPPPSVPSLGTFGLPLAGGQDAATPPVPAPGAPQVTPVGPGSVSAPRVGLAPAPTPTLPAPSPSADPVDPAEATFGPRLVLDELLMHVMDIGGSDLHLTVGAAPTVRMSGEMHPIEGYAKLRPLQLRETLYGIMTERQRKAFEEELELDFAYAVPGRARFRVNIFQQRESLGAVMRLIPWDIKPLDQLGLPAVIETFAHLKRGLVLVTGPTGSGKSTTLAGVIDRVNRTRHGHIMTIEDPIEFLHKHGSCLVNQREVGQDTHAFRTALKHVLRQDPDVVLVGELRDLDTISVALTAAETGHLVFATLHTQSAQDTITRVVDVFPAEQQQQVRTQLAATLQGVVCQTLVKTKEGKGRVAAVEIMVCNSGIRAMIRDDKLQQIQGVLQAGARDGMQTLNSHLAELVKTGRISYEVGLAHCSNRADFETLVGSTATSATSTSWQ